MRPYELVVLLHPDLEIDADTPIAKIEKLIDDLGGKVTKRDNWGKKRLAYRIKKQDFAVYVYFDLQLKPEAVRQVDSALLITEEVLRHLLVTHEVAKPTDTKKAKPAKAEAESAERAESKAAEPVLAATEEK
jgi:small subunit ribosomal protein S6